MPYMTAEDVERRLQRIRDCRHDPEAAHALEDELRDDFIRHVASHWDEPLSEMARLVLTSSQIEFTRWCA